MRMPMPEAHKICCSNKTCLQAACRLMHGQQAASFNCLIPLDVGSKASLVQMGQGQASFQIAVTQTSRVCEDSALLLIWCTKMGCPEQPNELLIGSMGTPPPPPNRLQAVFAHCVTSHLDQKVHDMHAEVPHPPPHISQLLLRLQPAGNLAHLVAQVIQVQPWHKPEGNTINADLPSCESHGNHRPYGSWGGRTTMWEVWWDRVRWWEWELHKLWWVGVQLNGTGWVGSRE